MNQASTLVAVFVEIDQGVHQQLTEYVSNNTRQDLQQVIQDAIQLFLNRT